MRWMKFSQTDPITGEVLTSIIVDMGGDARSTFSATVGNAAYDSFLESQSLTDAEVQAMEPDIWHDMA